MIFIYGLKCPLAGVVRYVGKSTNPEVRLRAHIDSSYRYHHHTARWIQKLINAGLEPELIILHRVAECEKWQEVERTFIASAGTHGWKLTNSTCGGEGLDYLDPADTAKVQAKRTASLKARYATPQGKAILDAVRAKGWSDPAIVARRIESVRAAHQKQSTRERVIKANREIASRPEVKAAQSASHLARLATPEGKAKRKAAMSSAKTRAKMSASATDRFTKPGAKAYFSNPERCRKIAESAVRRATPEYRAMMAEKTRLSWEKRRHG